MSDTQDNTDKKRKAANDAATTLRTENMTSGDILRAAREKRKLSVEDVSSAIHVRAAQIRAIEEGNIDALPGMTYAVGFVKSYAGYLKLNAVDLGNKFKAEHGALKPLMPDLPEPKPIVESRMPDPMTVGVAAFCALVLLLGWAFFSGGDEVENATLSEAIVAQTAVDAPPEIVTDEIVEEPAVVTTETTAEDAEAAAAPVVAADDEEISEPAGDTQSAVAAADSEDNSAETTPDTAANTEEVEEKEAEASTESAPQLPEKKPELTESQLAADEVAPASEPINIRKTGRIVFKARQASWIQVSDANERVVFKRLLKAGEQYTVPEGRGYTLITTNAGGLDLVVDGQVAPALGKRGEILRDLPLEPGELLKEKLVKSRINN